jgi:hypothetical protein
MTTETTPLCCVNGVRWLSRGMPTLPKINILDWCWFEELGQSGSGDV